MNKLIILNVFHICLNFYYKSKHLKILYYQILLNHQILDKNMKINLYNL